MEMSTSTMIDISASDLVPIKTYVIVSMKKKQTFDSDAAGLPLSSTVSNYKDYHTKPKMILQMNTWLD